MVLGRAGYVFIFPIRRDADLSVWNMMSVFLVQQNLTENMQEELEADVSLNVVQKLEKLLCALPEKYYNIGLSRIYELAEKYPKPYRHLMRSVNNGWEQAEKYLEKGMEEGMIREVSIPVVMAMVKGTVYCFMESDILYQNKLTYEQAKKEMVEILMKGIKTGGKSKDSGN